ncbi:MAG: Trm112 family protein [Candidatus Dadabacteria bacterium]
MLDEALLAVIVCPETKQDLEPAGPDLVSKINSLIEKGELLSRSKQKVTEPIDDGLVRKGDRKYLYPVRDDIPVLLVDESIPLEGIQ